MARHPDDPYRSGTAGDDPRTPSQLDSDLQADPEMREGPVTAGRLALAAVAIVLVFGAVIYGMSGSSTDPATNPGVATQTSPPPPSQTGVSNAPPVPPGVRDVTPRNAEGDSGITTGAAPAPTAPPSTPTGRGN
ncbi:MULTISPECIES: hypothetical protein [Rhodopseudomonas]|uniref:Uncharacterized protein n=1 Tax=Rhodopseudomonas palustris (strain DX-1) TaxID=652103 RepID=E6VCM2_RHOPX|nr:MULTISPECIES: hypothetical protein [Rhodopseudomonas]NEW85887.1 hypothetical protein [Rhodopseudomonas sp. WA056]QDL97876.1 hypothetical protein FLL57_11395 [Rhodopseudomonas palustris]